MLSLASQEGSRNLSRKPRKRGGSASRRGINSELDCLLAARDRSGQTIDALVGPCALKLAQLDKEALLVTDANTAYAAFSCKHAIAH
jgi:hypothetical protein